jgi:UDP-N-acetyl-2-amino-2-deoxyglucuronate dehydrogenase
VVTREVPRQPTFAVLGVGGFVARRHLEAIARVGGCVVAACDVRDTVGILDGYFPDARFFLDEDDLVDWLSRTGPVDYVSVCTPSHRHEQHIRLAWQVGADAVCEKPVALAVEAVDRLARLERTSGRVVHPILQLRYHPAVPPLQRLLRDSVERQVPTVVDAFYVSRRGHWYSRSWKADPERSGGLAFNIGIHLFDILTSVLGEPDADGVLVDEGADDFRMSGVLRFGPVTVRWLLSTLGSDLPDEVVRRGESAYRCFLVDGTLVSDYSDNYAALHQTVYREVLAGAAPRLVDARPGLELAARVAASARG